MMKGLFFLSLILNLVLGYFLVVREPKTEIVEKERLIIETHSAPEVTKVTQPEHPKKEISSKGPGASSTPSGDHASIQELEDAGDKMEADKLEFFTQELGEGGDKLQEHARFREDFYRKQAKLMKNFSHAEPTFEQRRELIKLEEDFHSKLEKLHGKKNWEKFLKYREKYNKKGYDQQIKDGKPFIFMNL